MSEWPLNVEDPEFGATPNVAADQGPAINRAIARAKEAGGGEIYIGPGVWTVNTTLAVEVKARAGSQTDPDPNTTGPVTIRGAGIHVTTLNRTSATTPVIRASGFGFGFDRMAKLTLEGLTIAGNNTAGTLLELDRAWTCKVDGVRLVSSGRTGLFLRQVFNSHIDNLWVEACGSGTDYPAVLFTGYDESQGASDTVLCSNWEFQNNSGTDLRLTGLGSSSTKTVYITNLKAEGGVGTHPFIDLHFAGGIAFENVAITNTAERVAPLIQQVGIDTGYANFFTNLSINGLGDSPYMIDVGTNRLIIVGLMSANQGTNAIRLRSGLPAESFYLDGLISGAGQYSNGTILDERMPKEYPKRLRGTATWDPGSLGVGATASQTVTVTGAVIGDRAWAGFTSLAAGHELNAAVTAADTVTVFLTNRSGNPSDLASGTLRVEVRR